MTFYYWLVGTLYVHKNTIVFFPNPSIWALHSSNNNNIWARFQLRRTTLGQYYISRRATVYYIDIFKKGKTRSNKCIKVIEVFTHPLRSTRTSFKLTAIYIIYILMVVGTYIIIYTYTYYVCVCVYVYKYDGYTIHPQVMAVYSVICLPDVCTLRKQPLIHIILKNILLLLCIIYTTGHFHWTVISSDSLERKLGQNINKQYANC